MGLRNSFAAITFLAVFFTAPEGVARPAYGRLPLIFEENQGQTDSRARFVSRGDGFVLYLTPSEMVVAMGKNERQNVLRIAFAGADPAVRLAGERKLPGKSNYFTGSNPAQWRSGVPHFASVRASRVYEGIDAVFYSTGRQLEYDFIVSPGANPDQLRLAIDGADRIELSDKGELELQVADSKFRLKKPLAYQQRRGRRREIPVQYRVETNGTIGFSIADYDRAVPLVIDPVLVYSSYLGGSGLDWGEGIAVDQSGNAYITGRTRSLNFPTTSGALDTTFDTSPGSDDAFVTKINAAGTAIVYSTYLGGSSREIGRAIAVDATGTAYLTGQTSSADFPIVNGFQQVYTQINAADDAYVVKLSPAGSTILYSTFLGGIREELPWAIAVDQAANAYVTGFTFSLNFPTTATAFQPNTGSGVDAFVTRINTNATGAVSLVYSTYLGGTATDESTGIDVDSVGNAYVTGETRSSDFPITTGGPINFQSGGFVTKLNPSGSALIYSRIVVGAASDIAVDAAGNAFLAGGGGTVAKINPTATAVTVGNLSPSPNPTSIALDPTGSPYVTGTISRFVNLVTVDAFQSSFGGGSTDAFVAKFSPALSVLYASYLGGSGDEADNFRGAAIAVDAAGNAYVTGHTRSSDFPTVNAFDPTFGGGSCGGVPGGFPAPVPCADGFVAKIGTGAVAANPTLSITPSSQTIVAGATGAATVTISAAQPAATTVTLSSSAPSAASVPSSVTIPAGATSATFNITGTSAGGPVTITGTLAVALGGGTATATVSVSNPVPAITSINPSSVTAGSGTVTLTLTGTNFVSGSVVNFNGSPRPAAFVSPTQLTATLTASDLAAPGTATITVLNSGPGGGTSNPVTLTIAAVVATGVPMLSPFALALLALSAMAAGYAVLNRY